MGTCRTIAAGRTRTVLAAAVLAASLGFAGCDGDVDADTVSPAPPGTPVDAQAAPDHPPAFGVVDDLPPDDDVPLRALEARVATVFVDALEHDSWICTGETSRVEYRLLLATDGTRPGTELDGAGTATTVTFGWAAIGAETLLLDYPDVGRQVELGSILFAGDDAFRANDGINGPLECRRQRYVDGEPTRDALVSAAGDVNRDVEAAAALATRIETRRVGEDTFAHWRCEVDDGRATGYVFVAPDVLGPEPRAVSFGIADELPGIDDGNGNGSGDADGSGGAEEARTTIDVSALVGERAFRWSATDGTTLLLVPLDTDLESAREALATLSLVGIVFPVEDAFTARRTDDGALLQCLRDGVR